MHFRITCGVLQNPQFPECLLLNYNLWRPDGDHLQRWLQLGPNPVSSMFSNSPDNANVPPSLRTNALSHFKLYFLFITTKTSWHILKIQYTQRFVCYNWIELCICKVLFPANIWKPLLTNLSFSSRYSSCLNFMSHYPGKAWGKIASPMK